MLSRDVRHYERCRMINVLKTSKNGISVIVLWFVCGCISTLICMQAITYFANLFHYNETQSVIARQTIGSNTLEISATTSWDNWCFVKYISVYHTTRNNALSQILSAKYNYTEHCPNIQRTPWIIQTGNEPADNPPFKVLTGGSQSKPVYSEYQFDDHTHRYELQSSPDPTPEA